MRDAVVGRELDALGVNHDEAHLGGGGAHEDRHDHGIDGHRFAGSGGTADEEVRHLCQIGYDRASFDVFSDGDLQRAGACIFEHVAQKHVLPRSVGHFDADIVRTGDRRKDAHSGSSERERDVVLEGRDAANAHACRQIHLEQSDRRPGNPAHDLGHDAEIFERLLQAGRRFFQLGVGSLILLGVLGGS